MIVAATGAGMSARATTVPDDSGGGEYMVEAREGPYTVGLANSFVGNSWRSQMVAELEYAVSQRDDIEELLITNANQDASAQNSQISDLVASGVDILLVERGLGDGARRRARAGPRGRRARGVVRQHGEHPAGIRVNTDQAEFGTIGAEWLVEAMGGSGSVIALHGPAGNPASDARWEAAKAVLDEAGIEVVGEANADWDLAQGRAAAADLLAAHPDVNGIYSQGGAMSLGALQALEAAGRDPLPVPGEGNNQFLKKWLELSEAGDFSSVAPSQPPSIVVRALEVGIAALGGEDPGADVVIPLPVIDQDNLADNVRPDLPDSLWLPTDLPEDVIQEILS